MLTNTKRVFGPWSVVCFLVLLGCLAGEAESGEECKGSECSANSPFLSSDLDSLETLAKKKSKACDGDKMKSFKCQKAKMTWWLVSQLEKNETRVNDYVDLVKRSSIGYLDLQPESWPEKLVYKAVTTWGDAVDALLFFKLKKFTKSNDLKLKLPHVGELTLAPRSHPDEESGRTLFDPGFNLKMKLPFFRDELKFAVSTGPSFIAGLAVGLVILGIKALFGPLILALKYMILSIFFKDLGPFDFLKIFAGHGPALGPGSLPGYGWEESILENYDPHHHHHGFHPYDNVLDKSQSNHGSTYAFFPYDQKKQPSHHDEIHKQPSIGRVPYTALNFDGDGRGQEGNGLNSFNANSGDGGDVTPTGTSNNINNNVVKEPEAQYVPSAALQDEVENYDPFYSPLLSRIDSIFGHLGFSEEGCKERAVCSIYKFPVKYAPYSNLLSAQLSKHQSELKRPVTTSPKILRYFKYMKAAKDGQGAQNCIELYPNCTNDTEKLSNLPMVKTFQQLTELMGTGSG